MPSPLPLTSPAGKSLPSLAPVVSLKAPESLFADLGGPSLQAVRGGQATVSMATPHELRNGAAVAWVQDLLDVEVDGKFGPITEDAVLEFQHENLLPTTGIIDRGLILALEKAKPQTQPLPSAEPVVTKPLPGKPEPKPQGPGTSVNATKANEPKPLNQSGPGTGKPIDIDLLQRTCNCGAPHGTTPVPTTKHIRTEGKAIFLSTIRAHRDGGAVAWVQDRLGLAPDGKHGPTTDAAIRAFQQANKLPVNGAIDQALLAALDKAGRKIALGAPTAEKIPAGRFPKPAMKVRPSPNYEPRDGEKIDTIVLHDTGNPVKDAATAEAADLRWLTTPGSNASAHYIVQRDGTITQLVSDEQMAYHAGQSYFQGKDSVGKRSLGIEICNQGNGAEPFTEKQMQSVTKLVGYLREKYKVQMSNIVSHATVAMPTGRKSDPGPNFDWKRLRSAIV